MCGHSGCVVYEMLTGLRPFQGQSVSETLAAIIKSDPNWGTLPSGTPILVTRLLRRCLAKDPRQRLGDMRDARLDIADALASPAASAAEGMPRSGRRERLAWMTTAVGLCAAAVLALFAFGILQLRETPAAPNVTRFTIQPPAGVLGTGAPKHLTGRSPTRVRGRDAWRAVRPVVAFAGIPDSPTATGN